MNNPSTIDANRLNLSDIATQIEWLLKSQPYLLELLYKVTQDEDCKKWLQRMPGLARLCNQKFGTKFTDFDLMRHALISDKEQRIIEVTELAKSQSIQLEKKDARKLYKLWSDAQLPEHTDMRTNESKVVSLLQHAWFTTSEALPQKLRDFLDAIESNDGLFQKVVFNFMDKHPFFAQLIFQSLWTIPLIPWYKIVDNVLGTNISSFPHYLTAMLLSSIPVLLVYSRIERNKEKYMGLQDDLWLHSGNNIQHQLAGALNKWQE